MLCFLATLLGFFCKAIWVVISCQAKNHGKLLLELQWGLCLPLRCAVQNSPLYSPYLCTALWHTARRSSFRGIRSATTSLTSGDTILSTNHSSMEPERLPLLPAPGRDNAVFLLSSIFCKPQLASSLQQWKQISLFHCFTGK